MTHNNIRWNPLTQDWFCLASGRTSDHVADADARTELEHYDCTVPWVEVPEATPDHRGDR